jgi:4-hydroxybenzoate polyprenyltransferase/phosphoserine phosphatase
MVEGLAHSAAGASSASPPLRGKHSAVSAASAIVVDLDGTLTPTDTLLESLIQLARRSPVSLLLLPLWLASGRAALKERVAARVHIAVDRLPYREPLLAYLRKERDDGRRVVLATAAHDSIARAVSDHLALFDDIVATREGRNAKGLAKLAAVRAAVGGDFVYAGDSAADIPIWESAQAAILVAVDPGTARRIRKLIPIEMEFPREGATVADWLRALRVHHWLKNLLLFVPLLTAFLFLDTLKLATIGVAFVAFSLVASATYVLNDLWDLESDRAHARKRLRPLASGKIPILHGVLVAACALLAGLSLALTVSYDFVLMLVLYLGLTVSYSWVLKAHVLIDVLVLSLLYTLRILAGSMAIGVTASSWLLAFSAFVFLSLALVKRCSELIALAQAGKESAVGRDYRVSDLRVLEPLGIGSALSAVVVFGLFISASETQTRYAAPQLLWLVGIELTYWLGRLWIRTSRGELHDDPVVDAVTDRTSLLTVIAMVATVVGAYFVDLDRFL